jgi:hypothetical protein
VSGGAGATVSNFYGYGVYYLGGVSYNCNYGLCVTLTYDVYAYSYNEESKFYDCKFENNKQGLYINGPGTTTNWRAGSSNSFKFVSCDFDASTTNNYVNQFRDSQFIECYFGFSSTDGLVLDITDGIEFLGCQVVFNNHNGIVINNGTTNFRWIGGEIRNNSFMTRGVFGGVAIGFNVTGVLIQGAYFGDFPPIIPPPPPPPPLPARPTYTSPSQLYGILFNQSTALLFTEKNIFISANFMGVQIISGVTYGGILTPPYPGNFTNPSSVVISNNFI